MFPDLLVGKPERRKYPNIVSNRNIFKSLIRTNIEAIHSSWIISKFKN